MNGIRRSRRVLPLTAVLAAAIPAAAACGGSGGSSPVDAPPASPHTAAERSAALNWLAKTNQMWNEQDFSAVDQVTTGEMRAIYQAEERQATPVSRPYSLKLTGLSVTVPCRAGGSPLFVAYADTDVFTLGQSLQPVAMIFQQVGGRWRLAAAVNRPGNGWPALCRQGTSVTAPAVVARQDYAPDLARVLTRAMTGAAQTTATAAPFALNGFLSGPGSVPAQAATWLRQDRRAGDSFTATLTPARDPTFALPLASGRGYWLVGILDQTSSYSSPSGLRQSSWPDGSTVPATRPAVVHHQTNTFITTYTAIDPLRSAGGTVALDGFFGCPLTATAR
jgi:hypothetical protein